MRRSASYRVTCKNEGGPCQCVTAMFRCWPAAGDASHDGEEASGGGPARNLRGMLSLRGESSGGLPDEPPAESRTSKFAAGLRARLGSGESGRGSSGGTGASSRFNSLRTRIMRGDLQTHTTDTAENSPVAPRLVRPSFAHAFELS